jgi:hypothetical protein
MNRPAINCPLWLDRTAVAIIILSAPIAAYLWVTL